MLSSSDQQPPSSSVARHALVEALDSLVVDCTSSTTTTTPSTTSALLHELLGFVRTPTTSSTPPSPHNQGDNTGVYMIGDDDNEGPLLYCFEQLLLRQTFLHMRSSSASTYNNNPVSPSSSSSVPSDGSLAAHSKGVFTRPPTRSIEQHQQHHIVGGGCDAREDLPLKWTVAVGSSYHKNTHAN